MKTYEKPAVEVLSFLNEAVMDEQGGVGGDFSVGDGAEEGAPV